MSPPAKLTDGVPPDVWERTLGSLVIGRSPGNELGEDLARERGVRLIEGLIHEFRASMIVGSLRLTSRFLMLALGPDAFRIILDDYWTKTPPQLYAGLEAEEFASYLKAIDLKIPQLAKVLEFEQAAMASVIDEQTRVVHFDFEPIPLLRALAESRLPAEPGRPGDYEIAIASDGPEGASGLDFQEVQQAFPFH